ncbi:hypothetical protein GCM10017691_24050 [Pseudonocardia petroleophila]|uniref:Uncharacterized protein n=1 Tax=Pseudonocardia petroleophila TaxID=37331 RepID=A0A7G7MFT8_9PSEU|nr:hypothetical protein [Pseudonocardia petroleophila]QNG51649.1 hypothetical protein H6H00_26675 [Pseudonocardia petroleophila]
MARRTEAQFAEQRAAVYEHRVRGLSYRAISAATNIPLSTVVSWCKKLTAARVQESQEELLAYELERLDLWQSRLEAQAEEGKQVARNTEVLLRLSERRAKLLGMDQPERIEATVHEITQEDLAIAELVRDAQAAAALEEQRIRDGAA